jgi:hypothetical protein
MQTIQTFAEYAGAVICLIGLIFAGVSFMSGNIQRGVIGLFGAIFGAAVLGWGAGWNNVARFAFDYLDLPIRAAGFTPRPSVDGGMKFNPDTLEPIAKPETKAEAATASVPVAPAESSGPFDRERTSPAVAQAPAQERAITPLEPTPPEMSEELEEVEEEQAQSLEWIREH